MYYIGADYHKKYSYVVLKDREGKVERAGEVNNTIEKFRQLLKPLQLGCQRSQSGECAPRLLTIVYRVLRQEHLYERRNRRVRKATQDAEDFFCFMREQALHA